jgi:hypothetical protein
MKKTGGSVRKEKRRERKEERRERKKERERKERGREQGEREEKMRKKDSKFLKILIILKVPLTPCLDCGVETLLTYIIFMNIHDSYPCTSLACLELGDIRALFINAEQNRKTYKRRYSDFMPLADKRTCKKLLLE